jgi:CTP synthase (UTP-ammonia lyase)
VVLVKIGIIGEFNPSFIPHTATNHAIIHSSKQLDVSIETEWISTEDVNTDFDRIVARCSGFWIAPGSPYRSMRGALNVIEYARKYGRPLLGTCGGYQHIVIEYARNVLQIDDAEHAEYDPYASKLVISKLTCSLVGQRLDIILKDKHSTVYSIFQKERIAENYYCNFGLNPEYQKRLDENGLVTVGVDENGESRIVELRDHPFFVGTLFVPQARSTEEYPHPLVSSFIQHVISAK